MTTPTECSQHTPGPWIARILTQPSPISRAIPPPHIVKVDHDDQGRKRTRFIAECNGANLSNEANARLIAAAPEMFAALSAILFANHTPDRNGVMKDMPYALELARAAIAKATGAP